MRFSALAIVVFASAAFAACATSPDQSETSPLDADIAATVSGIDAETDVSERMRMDVFWLADDARRGRETGTQGYLDAAKYVAARLEAIGAEPGVNGEWFQNVPFLSATPVLEKASISITAPDGTVHTLTHLDDFRVFPSLNAESFEIENAETVFVGFGVHAPAFGHDDYADVDVDGKVVVYFSGAPDIFDNESRAHFNSSSVKFKEASDRGAIGAISMFTAGGEESSPWDRYVANPSYTSMTWVWPDGRADTSGPNIKGNATLHPEKAPLMFTGAPQSYEAVRAAADAEGKAPDSFNLAVRVSMAGALEIENTSSPNVVGLIPGSDPDLKDEYVILTAHLDHVGINESLIAEGKDGINNGAVDNATGIAIMLEAARRLIADAPPKRSVIIAAVTGEEKGLLGADYFAHFPTINGGVMAANVNLDMPVMLHEFTDIIAFGAERSSLGPIMNDALEQTGVSLAPDPIPHLNVFVRSDHYRFVEKGVPSIFLWTGFSNGGEEQFWDFYRNHYHSPSDDPSQPIRYDDLARFADINYVIARAIANTPERPSWNEGDFFGDLFAGE
ncbi:M20/M25/M40 family metallo-hydrolase [Hyphococcus flavus]|uniref:M20/M25/M40 family metallo-hydrolase n=1 Tax=Hyphococcus flavus TaxID=1866326 RepID=A0AAE9ZA99_9PROT|nr:M20/M25/M40 family metallo-hydrolase [Hyphococcus flavus]WDI30518.1 M20/M25/M40 family metallo-hydrolase [Hyphococcus flavus]